MTRIFRGIRRRLLESEQTRRYLLYAVGELIIVTAGILIALQLNAWREARKDRAFELTMLAAIHAALSDDVVLFHRLQDRLETSSQFSDRVLWLLQERDTPAESLAVAIYASRTWIQLSFNRGPYDALKSTGIDKVRNDSLRLQLIRVYDYRMPRSAEFIENASERFASAAPLHQSLFAPRMEASPDGTVQLTQVLANDRARLDSVVPEMILIRRGAIQEAQSRLAPLVEDAERLLAMLEAEV